MLVLRNTSAMTAEEMRPLWPGIVTCLERYCRRFPDETVESIISKCAAGDRQLWVVLDGDEVVLTPVTEIVRIDATGRNRLILVEVGGSRLKECMPLLKDIEEWAVQEHEVADADLIGRDGWDKLLEPLGYRKSVRIYRKRIA